MDSIIDSGDDVCQPRSRSRESGFKSPFRKSQLTIFRATNKNKRDWSLGLIARNSKRKSPSICGIPADDPFRTQPGPRDLGDGELVSCPRNSRYIVAIKMGRRLGKRVGGFGVLEYWRIGVSASGEV